MDVCEGCGHPVHRARQCPAGLYGERCACDEPLPPARLSYPTYAVQPPPDGATVWTLIRIKPGTGTYTVVNLYTEKGVAHAVAAVLNDAAEFEV